MSQSDEILACMNAHLSESLYRDFPALYRGRSRSTDESAMSWGFQCDDGWYALLRELSRQLADAPRPIEAFQVKQKFGALRFQLVESDPASAALIEEASRRSLSICEISGAPGELCVKEGRRPHYKTLSPQKALELGYRRVKNEETSP
ncbi:hypothetical protein LNV47_01470 [Paucibacter sp. DJ4R-1]|nr:hypothetical protein [Paucibacter sp. DJ4R-1]